jgi:hypothetical protein
MTKATHLSSSIKCASRLKFILFICLLHVFAKSRAQPYLLKSVGESKPFSVRIFVGDNGKGAFAQYMGRKGFIPLRLQKITIEKTGLAIPGSAGITYLWAELTDNKVSGQYLLQVSSVKAHAWYHRYKDGRKFNLELADSNGGNGDGQDKLFLHGMLLSYSHSQSNLLTIERSGKQVQLIELPDIVSPGAKRLSTVADYNFDGFDDVAFSLPDAGMGVYREFSIWLYNPASRLFDQLQEPSYAQSQCAGITDVTLDSKNRLLLSSCRGSAKWWQDEYRFNGKNKLIWVKSREIKN